MSQAATIASRRAALTPLIEAASAYYRDAGRWAWHFARGKLGHDPVFGDILAHGLLAGRDRILDLGCGQGLLAAWLLAARTCHAGAVAGAWPSGWPSPPRFASYAGVEIDPHEVARARRAFLHAAGATVQVVHGDIRDMDYGPADAVVILDVLHYLDYPEQQRVLQRARDTLRPQGLLLLRVGDAARSFRFALGQAVDRTVALARRHRWFRLHGRSLSEWQELLGRCGFSTRALLPMSAGTPFVNTLLLAHLP